MCMSRESSPESSPARFPLTFLQGLGVAAHGTVSRALAAPREGEPGQWHFLNHFRADERLVSRLLQSPGPHQAFPCPPAFPLWSGVFLVSARSLSESGGLGALS